MTDFGTELTGFVIELADFTIGMTHTHRDRVKGRREGGGRGFLVNNGEGLNVIPQCGRENDSNSNENRNEIK